MRAIRHSEAVTASSFRRIALIMVLALSTIAVFGQRSGASHSRPSRSGQQIFASSCSGCHGLDGRGSERAPGVAGNPKVQRMSDQQVFRIISEGVAGTGMPAFHSLSEEERHALVKHLRSLEGSGRAGTLPGNPVSGKTLFFGKGQCSSCHMAAGQGGFLGPDLTAFAHSKSAQELRGAINHPASDHKPRSRRVVATMREGRKFEGIVRNEDNFSLQLQDMDGSFHFLDRSDIQTLEDDPHPFIPQDYGERLSRSELDDLASYLMSVARTRKAGPPRREEE